MKWLAKSFIPEKAFDEFKKAEICYKQQGSLSSEVLETLHSYFGESLVRATELFEKCKIICYSTPDSCRNIYEVSTRRERQVVFENINFCQCPFFKHQVLDTQNSLTCKHVLAVYLARIMGKILDEKLGENLFEEYLNVHLHNFLDEDTPVPI